jgi:hypothetical protein
MPEGSRSLSERVTVARPHWQGKQDLVAWKCLLLGVGSARVQRCGRRDVWYYVSTCCLVYAITSTFSREEVLEEYHTYL